MLPRTARWRGGFAFVEKWTNAKAALIGFMIGRGYSNPAIAERLDDGTSADSIRWMTQKWGLPTWGRKNEGFLMIPVTTRLRSNVHVRAQAHGLSDEEFVRRIITCATMPTDLYDAIVPEGQFEDVQ